MMDLTDKQKIILKTVWLGHERGRFIDMDELLELITYKTTKQSMQFSIRALIKRGLLEKTAVLRPRKREKQYQRRCYSLTPLGSATVKILLSKFAI